MKKLRYDRVMLVVTIFIFIIGIILYMYMNMSHYYEYKDNIKTYVGTYRQDGKIYTFDLKAFQVKDDNYISLNDLYNVMIILDNDINVYIQENKHVMVYELSDITYYFNYGQDTIVYNNDCIKLEDYNSHIYISHKNIYLNVFFVEKLLFKNEKKIKFQNETAIIE